MPFQFSDKYLEKKRREQTVKTTKSNVDRYFKVEVLTALGVRNLLIYVLRSLDIPWTEVCAICNVGSTAGKHFMSKTVDSETFLFNHYYNWQVLPDNTQQKVSNIYNEFTAAHKDPTFEEMYQKVRKEKILISRRRVYQIIPQLGLSFKKGNHLAKPNNPELAQKRIDGAKELQKLFERAEKGEVFLIFQDETTLTPNAFTNHYHIAPIGEPAYCNAHQSKFDPYSIQATIFTTMWGILYYDTLDIQYNSYEFMWDLDKCLINLQQHPKYWQDVQEIYFVYDRASFHTSHETLSWFDNKTVCITTISRRYIPKNHKTSQIFFTPTIYPRFKSS